MTEQNASHAVIEPLGWLGIVRLGLVQAALGAVVVLSTSTLNRIMVVEHALPAILPGVLVGLHYAMQFSRPRMGYGSDAGGRRTPWIVGGMAVLASGGLLAALATALMGTHLWLGVALAFVAYVAIGAGVSAAGTTLLALLAKRTAHDRRAAAATIVWTMMIAGFAITATVAGHALDPYSPQRLIVVFALVSVGALAVAALAIRNIETDAATSAVEAPRHAVGYRQALAEVWSEPVARRFTIFIFISMLAYSGQELILDPFAGAVFAYTPGESTKLAGLQHGGVLAGMLFVAVAAGLGRGTQFASLRLWAVCGCIGSALALLGLIGAGLAGQTAPLRMWVAALGVANGVFAIAAIGRMMGMASEGHAGREGVRMGLWGAAQGIAFGVGGLVGAGASDLAKLLLGSPSVAYASVFALEAALFVFSAFLAAQTQSQSQSQAQTPSRSGTPDSLAALRRWRLPRRSLPLASSEG